MYYSVWRCSDYYWVVPGSHLNTFVTGICMQAGKSEGAAEALTEALVHQLQKWGDVWVDVCGITYLIMKHEE